MRRTSTRVARAFDIGIDIGSANAVVASSRRGVLFDEPSCVAFESGDRRPSAFGYEAALTAGKSGDRLVVVHPMSRAKAMDADALHCLFSYIFESLDATDVEYRSASIAVSTDLTSSEQSMIARILTEIGVKQSFFVADIVAASLVDRHRRDPEKPTAVIDIGAEVTSWGLVEAGVLKEFATWDFGVKDLSQDLSSLMQRRYGLGLANSQAESIIASVGCRGYREQGLTARIGAKNMATGTPVAHMVLATDVVDAIGGCIEDLSLRLKRCFDGLPERTARSLIDAEVALVGGGALVPGLAQELHARLGFPMAVDASPLHTTALGAARMLVCCD